MRSRFSKTLVVLAAVLSGAAYWFWSKPSPRIPERRVVQVAVSPSGWWFAAGSVAGKYAIWQRDRPGRAQQLRIPDATPRALAFNPDESHLAIAHSTGLALQPVQEMDITRPLRTGTGFRATAFQPQTGLLLAANDAGSIEWIQDAACCGSAPGIAFSADGSLIATSGSWPALWESDTGMLAMRLGGDGEFGEFEPVTFDNARGWVLMGGRDGRVYAWDARTGELRGMSPQPAGAVESLAVLKDSPWIAFAKTGAPLHMWNPDTGEMQTLGALPSSNVVAGPEPGSVLFGNYAGSVELWDVETRAVLSRFTLR